MDEADHAKKFERFHRQQSVLALAAHGRMPQSEAPLIINGRVCCLDCKQPVEKERLEKRPESVRCVPCKSIHERKHPYVPPFANEKGMTYERRG